MIISLVIEAYVLFNVLKNKSKNTQNRKRGFEIEEKAINWFKNNTTWKKVAYNKRSKYGGDIDICLYGAKVAIDIKSYVDDAKALKEETIKKLSKQMASENLLFGIIWMPEANTNRGVFHHQEKFMIVRGLEEIKIACNHCLERSRR